MKETDSLESSSADQLSRRDVLRGAAAITATGMFIRTAIAGAATHEASPSKGDATLKPLDIETYSWAWVGVQRSKVARGTVPDGGHMCMEYQIPSQVKYPYAIVLIHGGDGQALDWMGTPDGRRGWATYLLEQGYKVYVVDRPGQGRPIYDPALFGHFGPATTYESVRRNIAAIAKTNPPPHPTAHLHSQWPGTGEIGDAVLDQFLASLGPAFLYGGSTFNPRPDRAHEIWRARGAMLMDEIGPAIVVTHGDSSPFAWLVADARPKLVKGIVAIEPAGPAFGRLIWGLTAAPMTYDPPAATAEDIAQTEPINDEPSVLPYRLQTAPPRRLKNLAGIPIAVVTAEASDGNLRNHGTVAFLRQAGCSVDDLRLSEHGVRGNGPYMMLEKNNREALLPILAWINQRVPQSSVVAAAAKRPLATDSTAVKLADQGYFWTGVGRKETPYGTIATGQMYVQYFIPQKVRYPHSVVLIHGGGGQATHMMGLLGRPGWLHYFVQEGYRVYMVDRPASGRSPYHPDAFNLAHMGLFNSYEQLATVFRTPQWPGTGEIGDPALDQFIPDENGPPTGEQEAIDANIFVNAGTALLDRIGPAILLTHAYSGQLGWALADRRPALVKGIVTMEPNGGPFTGQMKWGLTSIPVAYDPPAANASELSLVDFKPASPAAGGTGYKIQSEPARRLKNLQGLPIGWLTCEVRSNGTANNGPAGVAFLKQAGCKAEHLQAKDYGVLGNGNLMSIELNNKQVFDLLRDWLAKAVAAPSKS